MALSVFDLTPAEKLQLVEDLWDDLAASPEDVPVHEWQKQELARLKENLQRNPASAATWDDVSDACAATMAADLVLAPEAERDIAEAYAWYEARSEGLGERFLAALDARFALIQHKPLLFACVLEAYRRALLRRFPYAVFFECSESTVTV